MEFPSFEVPRQLAFEFNERPEQGARRKRPDNVYFAVLPDADAARRMTEVGDDLKQRFKLPGRVQPAPVLHISMAHVGSFASLPEGIVALARKSGCAVRCPPFDVRFDHARSFDNSGRSPVVLRCGRGDAEFADLRRAILTAMARIGLSEAQPIGLTPHATLVYRGRPISSTVLAEPISWTVREFVLVHSLFGRGRHIHLGRWPLGG